MEQTFAAPDLDDLLTEVDKDIGDTKFVLTNTQYELPELDKRLDESERVRQTVLTDSDDETEEMRQTTRSATIRETKEQRNQEVADLKTHLQTAEAFKSLVQDTKRKQPDESDYQESIKRVRSFPYRAAQYSFNNFDDDF